MEIERESERLGSDGEARAGPGESERREQPRAAHVEMRHLMRDAPRRAPIEDYAR